MERRSTPELVRDVAEDLQMLVRKEVELARTELLATLVPKLRGAGLIVAAFLLSLPGLLFCVIALVLALPFSAQTGFAIVGGALLFLSLGGVAVGWWLVRRRSRRIALESIKEDVAWARERLRQ